MAWVDKLLIEIKYLLRPWKCKKSCKILWKSLGKQNITALTQNTLQWNFKNLWVWAQWAGCVRLLGLEISGLVSKSKIKIKKSFSYNKNNKTGLFHLGVFCFTGVDQNLVFAQVLISAPHCSGCDCTVCIVCCCQDPQSTQIHRVWVWCESVGMWELFFYIAAENL